MRAFAFLPMMWLVAGAALAAPGDFDPVYDRIQRLVPDASDVAVAETPVDGIVEVRIGSEIVYMSADGRYLLQGRVVDLETQIDLTEAAQAELRLEAIANIDESQLISFAPDNPIHEIYAFTDIDCGYCRQMHGKMDEYHEQGITFHYLMYPRAGEGSHSWDKAVSVWCADDSQQAMTTAKQGQEPTPAACENPIKNQFELGRVVGVTGTPALVTKDGVLIPGFVQPQALRTRLDQLNGQ